MKKLLSLLLFVFAFITANATTLNGTLQNPDGSGFTGTLYLSIAQQVGISSLGSCGGPILVVPTVVIPIGISNGVMISENGASTSTPFVYGGDCTLPAGMPYNAVLKDSNGNTMFSTMWLITGTGQNIGTIYSGPQPIPPTALTGIFGIGSPSGLQCSAQSMYIQTNASGGAYLFPCINGVFVAQGAGGGGGGSISIGGAVSGGTANSALFVDGSGNLNQDPTNYSYNISTHVLTLAQPIVGSITGNANTSTSLSVTPSLCTGSQVAYGISTAGNAQCKTLTYADIGGSSSGLVVSVFGRSGTVLAVANDYNFNQIAGTVSTAQLAGSGAITTVPGAGIVGSNGSALTTYTTTGSGTVVALATSPVFVTPTLGVAFATSINGTTIPSSVTLMTTATSVLAAQMPALTGDVTTSVGTVATSLAKIQGVPFCSGFTPTNGQALVYTTGGSPSPCYSSSSTASGVTLKTNGVTNGSQSILNLQPGTNMAITQDNAGNVNISCPACAVNTPLGISMGIDWPPTTTTAMNDEFTTAFNVSNIWTVVNQGTSTIADSYSLLNVNVPAHSGDSFVGIYQSIPSTPYAVETKLRLTGEAANGYYGGLAFRDSGTGLVVAERLVNGNTLKIDHWASPTSLTSTVSTITLDSFPSFLEVKDDGTNFYFMISQDGVNFVTAYQESRTAYLGSPGQVGYMAGSSSTSSAMALGSDWFRRVL